MGGLVAEMPDSALVLLIRENIVYVLGEGGSCGCCGGR